VLDENNEGRTEVQGLSTMAEPYDPGQTYSTHHICKVVIIKVPRSESKVDQNCKRFHPKKGAPAP
jgi:hypothetical protein